MMKGKMNKIQKLPDLYIGLPYTTKVNSVELIVYMDIAYRGYEAISTIQGYAFISLTI